MFTKGVSSMRTHGGGKYIKNEEPVCSLEEPWRDVQIENRLPDIREYEGKHVGEALEVKGRPTTCLTVFSSTTRTTASTGDFKSCSSKKDGTRLGVLPLPLVNNIDQNSTSLTKTMFTGRPNTNTGVKKGFCSYKGRDGQG